MERDFEQEFRALKQSEIPDLWNRIEAGISEKTVPAPAKPEAKRRYSWRTWGTAAAACLCLAVVFPALVLFVGKQNKGETGSMSAAAPDDGEPMYADVGRNGLGDGEQNGLAGADRNSLADAGKTEAPETDMLAEAAKEDGNAESAMESAAMERSEGSSASADVMQESAADTAAAGESVTDSLRGSEAELKNDVEKVSEQESMAAAETVLPLEEGSILTDVTVRIEDVIVSAEGVLYQITIEKSDIDVVLNAGTKAPIICNDDTEYDFPVGPREQRILKENASYTVTLCYEQNRLFVLTAAEK